MAHGLSAHTFGSFEHTDATLLSNAELRVAFESCTLSAEAFRHYEHVRLAWIYLGVVPVEEATRLMADGIRRFALHHTGSTAKYNERLTRAWVRVVARARESSPIASTFSAFIDA